ncbi:MAG: xylulokinase [Defluviitaleaceae bacterium]|nr:xylulokinase [Defluviitaleaceae bacterium]MCL2836934.1 xylulokinase [Defluviitaleaceae bacterium]
MSYFLGIDVGTSGTKALIMDESGRVLCTATEGYAVDMPQNGWAEQHPGIWWEAAIGAVRGVLKNAEYVKGLKAVGLTGQMHGLAMLDKKGDVIRPALLWCDQRTGDQCRQITEAVGEKRLIELTANPALTGFTSPKILWVRENEPENYAKCASIMLPKDYIRYKLTGDNAGDMSDASGTGLLDVPRRCWSDEVLDKLNIDKGLLGKLYESCEVTGQISEAAARETGLPAGLPVVAGAGDNAAAAIGTGVARDGRAFVTIGSSGVVFAHTSVMKLDPAGRAHAFCAAVPGEWHVMGVSLAAGMSLQWLRNQALSNLCEQAAKEGRDVYDIMSGLAARSPIGSNRLIFLPYLNGERTPHKDPDCRGVFFGLSASHTQNDLIRAVMEGVSFAGKDSLDIIREMGIGVKDITACGGGGGSAFWRGMLADVFGIPVAAAQSQEGPALGAAILAAVGAGVFKSVPAACDALITTNAPAMPEQSSTAGYAKYHVLFKSLYASLKDDFKTLSAL